MFVFILRGRVTYDVKLCILQFALRHAESLKIEPAMMGQ